MKAAIWVKAWFFAEIDVRQYAVLRIGLGLLIIIYLYQLLPFSILHFSSDGWLDGLSTAHDGPIRGWSILSVFANAKQVRLFWLAAMLFAASFAVGFYSRSSGWLTWIALVSIWHRNPLLLDGDDAILRLMLFYLLFSPCGAAYSIDSLGKQPGETAPVWPLRLMQFQLALVYFVSGMVKFLSPQWLDGSILPTVLSHPQYSRWDFSRLLVKPWFTSVLAYLSDFIRWWEVLFPLMLCQRYSRAFCILIGVLFHLALLLIMHLRLFPIIMLVLYATLLPNAWFIKKLVKRD